MRSCTQKPRSARYHTQRYTPLSRIYDVTLPVRPRSPRAHPPYIVICQQRTRVALPPPLILPLSYSIISRVRAPSLPHVSRIITIRKVTNHPPGEAQQVVFVSRESRLPLRRAYYTLSRTLSISTCRHQYHCSSHTQNVRYLQEPQQDNQSPTTPDLPPTDQEPHTLFALLLSLISVSIILKHLPHPDSRALSIHYSILYRVCICTYPSRESVTL